MKKHARRQTVHSNTFRFFVPPDAIQGRDVALEDAEIAHQLASVLRLRPGEQILLLDNSGWQYTVQLTQLGRERVEGIVERKELAAGEPRTKLTLYVAVMRPERFEWVLQKGTELGVSAFVPLICERSVVGDAGELSERKQERWGRIVREAAEQARRGKLPRLAAPQPFSAACQQAAERAGTTLLLWEGAGVAPLRQTLRGAHADAPAAGPPFSVSILSGPEGGLTSHELASARDCGIIPVTLGPRTLRAETAPLAAISAVLYEMGDLE